MKEIKLMLLNLFSVLITLQTILFRALHLKLLKLSILYPLILFILKRGRILVLGQKYEKTKSLNGTSVQDFDNH